jgi:phosphomannomutase/phosphoglucomutase
VEAGVQITGSHNPPDENGLKICLGKTTIHGEEIQEIRKIVEGEAFADGEGGLETLDIIPRYQDYLKENLKPGPKAIKVVVDAGNGTGGFVGVPIYRALGFEVIELFCEPDGDFPNHHPDPTMPANLETMIKTVKEHKADLGIGFDGDADRIGVVDNAGRIIWGDRLMAVYARDILKDNPGATIVSEVKCSQTLYDDIEARGGRAIMWKAGHSLIKAKMKEEKALFGGEMSGHMFFVHRYFGFDDAIYAGGRLLELLSRTEGTLSDMLSDMPETVTTPEIRTPCPDDRKFDVVKALVEEFRKEYDVVDVDGARVIFDFGWGLVRASNTQPVLVMRFEAQNEDQLEKMQKLFEEKIAKHT